MNLSQKFEFFFNNQRGKELLKGYEERKQQQQQQQQQKELLGLHDSSKNDDRASGVLKVVDGEDSEGVDESIATVSVPIFNASDTKKRACETIDSEGSFTKAIRIAEESESEDYIHKNAQPYQISPYFQGHNYDSGFAVRELETETISEPEEEFDESESTSIQVLDRDEIVDDEYKYNDNSNWNNKQQTPSQFFAANRQLYFANKSNNNQQQQQQQYHFQRGTPNRPNFRPNHVNNNTVNNDLLPIDSIPSEYQHLFPYSHFNFVQSECFDIIWNTDYNVLVSAPTGCGKTGILELSIIRLLHKQSPKNRIQKGKMKAVYMAPIKALCQQVYESWNKRFSSLGVVCKEITGDNDSIDYEELRSVDIVITTPEKWDSMTRKWKDHQSLIGQTALFLIDEVHLLNEDRGATLEAVVSRMITVRHHATMKDHPSANLRFIALSATIPNMEDIAE